MKNKIIFLLFTGILSLFISCNKITRKVAEVETVKTAKKLGEKSASKDARKAITENTEKSALKDAFNKWLKNDYSTIINDYLGQRGQEEWSKIISKGSKQWSKTLAKDLMSNKTLAKEVSGNPALLHIYANCIESPKFRTNVTWLRYAGNNSDKLSNYFTRKEMIRGENLILIDKGKSTIIKHNRTGIVLGEIDGNSRTGFTIKNIYIDHKSHIDLIDLYPLPNTKYETNNICWVTDNFGRPKNVIFINNISINPQIRNL